MQRQKDATSNRHNVKKTQRQKTFPYHDVTQQLPLVAFLCKSGSINEAAKVLATSLSNDTYRRTLPPPPPTTLIPTTPYPLTPPPDPHHPIPPWPPLPPTPDPHHPLPPPPNGRVLCTVLVTIPWAGPLSLIELHSSSVCLWCLQSQLNCRILRVLYELRFPSSSGSIIAANIRRIRKWRYLWSVCFWVLVNQSYSCQYHLAAGMIEGFTCQMYLSNHQW